MIEALKEFIVNNQYSKERIYLIGNVSLYAQGFKSDYSLRDIDIVVGLKEFYNQETSICKIDCIQPHLALLASGWEERAKYYTTVEGVEVYALSLEDIIVNKMSGYHFPKHRNSIQEDIQQANLDKVRKYLEDVKSQEFILIRDELFRSNIAWFEKDYLT